MRELVKRGVAAIPFLINHLDDQRPTKVTINYERVGFGGMFFEDEYDYNRRTTKQAPKGVNRRDRSFKEHHPRVHTVTVGDVCFVVLGQIVNRDFNAARDQPTGCVIINSPTYSAALRKAIKEEWGNLTPQGHRNSLMRDLLQPDSEKHLDGACLRLGYYYPDLLEPLALKQLAEPRYNVFEVQTLIREKLYRAKDAAERKKLFDDFIAERGEIARQGVLVYLLGDLDFGGIWESKGRRDYPQAYLCLKELFGYSKASKGQDRPRIEPLENCTQARFIDALAFFPSASIDRAVLPILHSTDENNLAVSCARYLAGRGADLDIRESIERRLKEVVLEKDKRGAEWYCNELKSVLEMQGWTPLHAAAHVGLPERITDLITKGANVNAHATNGQTPLHVAANRGSGAAVRVLLEHKADPNLKDQKGLTPIQLAMYNDFDGTVDLLLRGGAVPVDILVASFAGRADEVQSLLKKEKSTTSPPAFQPSVAAPAKPSQQKSLTGAQTEPGDTPLHLAAQRGHAKVAEVLLSHGADVTARNGRKLTPLHWAAFYAKTNVTSVLLAHGANPNLEDQYQQTPLSLARERGNQEMIRLLEKAP